MAAEGKSRAGGENKKKKLREDERSRNVYENKQEYDYLPENKATFLHNGWTFYTNAPVFCDTASSSVTFRALGGMNSSLQNEQTRGS